MLYKSSSWLTLPPVGTAVLRLAPAKECIRAEAMVSNFNAQLDCARRGK